MTLPEDVLQNLNKLSEVHGIPIESLTDFYTAKLNDEDHIRMWPELPARMEYVDMLISGYIQEFHATVMEDFEIICIKSQSIFATKAGQMMCNVIAIAKRPGEEETQRPKWLKITCLEESGNLLQVPSLSTGIVSINIQSETDTTVEGFSTHQSEFKASGISWVKDDAGKVCVTTADLWTWLNKRIKTITVAEASQNLAKKDEKGYALFNDLRIIQGTVSTRRISKKVDETTQKERITGIITITDKSIAGNPAFFQKQEIPDPNNPGQKKTKYGGFSAFVDPVDISNVGRESFISVIGNITSDRNMNVTYIHPHLLKPPLKPTDRIQKPTPTTPSTAAPVNNPESVKEEDIASPVQL